jgi:hypothetical protein
MFLKEFPIAPHFYPICFCKYCSPFTYIGGHKGGPQYFKIEPFIPGASIVSIYQSDGNQIGSLGRGRGVGGMLFSCSQCVPIKLRGSQRVPQVAPFFPKAFPIALASWNALTKN